MDTTATARTAPCQFSLVKGEQRYMIRCAPGDEVATVAHLMEWADDPDLDFDWFDAAVVSRQIAQRVVNRVAGETEES